MDEVDSLLSSRSDLFRYSSKREVLNELMAGWDGLLSNHENAGVLVMAATNRPFDLDEAVLRRLPRRVMIDLPDAPSREAILRLLLRDELLANDVNLSEMAKLMNGFSGSDLKNICMNAAMNAVREILAQTSDYLHRVTLHRRHFTKATKEMAPSISEEAEMLIQLRKWNSLYGENASRQKTNLGFN